MLFSLVVCVFLQLGRVTLMSASLGELGFSNTVTICLLPVEQKQEKKAHISSMEK